MEGLLSETGFERYQARLAHKRYEGMPAYMADIIAGIRPHDPTDSMVEGHHGTVLTQRSPRQAAGQRA